MTTLIRFRPALYVGIVLASVWIAMTVAHPHEFGIGIFVGALLVAVIYESEETP